MEIILGIIAFLCLMMLAHYAQVSAQQLRKLNKTMETFLKRLE